MNMSLFYVEKMFNNKSDKKFNNKLAGLKKVLNTYNILINPLFYEKVHVYYENNFTHDDKLYTILIIIYSIFLPDDISFSTDTFECLFDKFDRNRFVELLMKIPPFMNYFNSAEFLSRCH